MERRDNRWIPTCLALALWGASTTAMATDPLRIDGSSDAAAMATFKAMTNALPPPQQLQLQMALLQLNADGVETASQMPTDPSAATIRQRIHDMTADEIIAEARKAAAREGAPRLQIQP